MCARILLSGSFTIIADTALDLGIGSLEMHKKSSLHPELWAPQESAQRDDQHLV